MWIWIACGILVLFIFAFRIKESFQAGTAMPTGVKFVKITNNNPADISYLTTPDNATYMQISQVAVFDENGINVSVRRNVTASAGVGNPSIAVDGALAERAYPSIWHSNSAGTDAFWQVTLWQPTTISRVEFYNRLDCCQGRAIKSQLNLLDAAGKIIKTIPFTAGSAFGTSLKFEFGDKTGPAGAQGPKGDKGSDGANGVAGSNGVKGDKGDKGADGAVGQKGDKGADGAAGSNGAPGTNGKDGINGKDGLAGPAGLNGIAGTASTIGSVADSLSGTNQGVPNAMYSKTDLPSCVL